MKQFLNKTISKKIKVQGVEIELKALSLNEVMELQEVVADLDNTDEMSSNLTVMRSMLRVGVLGADEMSDEDFNSIPLSVLSEAVSEVLAYAGLGAADEGNS